MRIVVTGSSGHLASVLIPRLLAQPGVERIVGIDVRPPTVRDARFQAHLMDVRDPQLERHLEGAHALVHMAFVVLRGGLGARRHDRELIRAINCEGSRNVFECALRQGVGAGVFLSSAAVYGAWPDAPPRLGEDCPLRPLPGFAYAEDKVAVETWLDARSPAAMRIVRLRPHVILGTQAQPLLKSLLRQPFHPRLPAPLPALQCVWEDDVAEAVLLAVQGEARGAFNLAAEPALSFRAMHRYLHRISLPLPYALLRAAVRTAWRFGGALDDPAWVDGLRHPVVLDCTRAHARLGWQPRASVYDCLNHVAGHGDGRGRQVQETETRRQA